MLNDKDRLFDEKGYSFVVSHNLKGNDIHEWVRQFQENEKCRKLKRVNSVLATHEIISFHKDDAKNITLDKLEDIARQYVRDNNGRLLASGKYLSKRGWRSADVIQRAKKELIDAGFIYETVKGHRPNKASWYAITWQDLDKHHGYDAGTFEGWRDARSGYEKSRTLKIKRLIPSSGVSSSEIVPSSVVKNPLPTVSDGTINATFMPPPIPSNGNHLELPSINGVMNVI